MLPYLDKHAHSCPAAGVCLSWRAYSDHELVSRSSRLSLCQLSARCIKYWSPGHLYVEPSYDPSKMAEERMPLILNATDGTSTASYRGAPSWNTVAMATYYTLVVCLGGLQYGLVIVFSSPLLDDFQSNLPANFTVWSGFNQCTFQDLVGPISPAGAVLGSIISSPVVALTGFVTGLVVMSSLFLSGWLLMAVSYFTYHGWASSAVWFRTVLFLGRLLTGVGAGWAAGVVPVSEGSRRVHAQ